MFRTPKPSAHWWRWLPPWPPGLEYLHEAWINAIFNFRWKLSPRTAQMVSDWRTSQGGTKVILWCPNICFYIYTGWKLFQRSAVEGWHHRLRHQQHSWNAVWLPPIGLHRVGASGLLPAHWYQGGINPSGHKPKKSAHHAGRMWEIIGTVLKHFFSPLYHYSTNGEDDEVEWDKTERSNHVQFCLEYGKMQSFLSIHRCCLK